MLRSMGSIVQLGMFPQRVETEQLPFDGRERKWAEEEAVEMRFVWSFALCLVFLLFAYLFYALFRGEEI